MSLKSSTKQTTQKVDYTVNIWVVPFPLWKLSQTSVIYLIQIHLCKVSWHFDGNISTSCSCLLAFSTFKEIVYARENSEKGSRDFILLLTTCIILAWTVSVSINKSTSITHFFNEFNYLRWNPFVMATLVVMEDTRHTENKPFSLSFYLCICLLSFNRWIYKLSVIKKVSEDV